MFGALQGSRGHGIYRSGNGQEKQKFFKVHVIEHRGIVLTLIKKRVSEKSRSFFVATMMELAWIYTRD